MITIKVLGKEYPYVPTMGAMIAFKQDTGIEANAVDPNDTELNVRYAYHVTKAAAKAFGEEPMTLSFEEFCAALTTSEYFRVVAASISEAAAEIERERAAEGADGKKKR